MKDLEEILNKTAKPKVQVAGFQSSLRRSLLDSHRFRSGSGINFRTAFCLSTAAAAICAVFLLVFILQPSLAWKLHYAVLPSAETGLQENDLPGRFGDQRAMFSDGDAKAAPAALQQVAARDIDQEFVRLLAKRQYRRDHAAVEPIAVNELFSVSSYRLDNGKVAFVYTKVPARRTAYSESY